MTKQLFQELIIKELLSNLDEKAGKYALYSLCPSHADFAEWNQAIRTAYKVGATAILADIIDLLKKYSDLRES